MSYLSRLENAWKIQKSFVCVGLDPHLNKLPPHLKDRKRPIFDFCKEIVDATAPFVSVFKPQIAYFSSQRSELDLEEIIAYIHEKYPQHLVILDAKRSDFEVTAEQYAAEAFDRYKADALTVVPFQGTDALRPYLERADKGIIILCKTSNQGSADFQDLIVGKGGEPLFQLIARKAVQDWNQNQNVSLVVGATFPEELKKVREIVGDMPLLVPGVGAQGGNMAESVRKGQNSKGGGLIISASRSIIYASSSEDFASAAAKVANQMKDDINQFLT